MGKFQQFLDQYFKENYKRFSMIAANQLRRFGIRGDIFDLQNDVTMSVITKFFYRYENDLNGLKQLIQTDKLNAYLITSIRNYVSDLRDKQNNDPLGNQIGEVINKKNSDEQGENTENDQIIMNDPTSPFYEKEVEIQNPEKINQNKQLYQILINELDEESINIWRLVGNGNTFLQISTILNINHNTIRTKWTSIRLKAMNILKKEQLG